MEALLILLILAGMLVLVQNDEGVQLQLLSLVGIKRRLSRSESTFVLILGALVILALFVAIEPETRIFLMFLDSVGVDLFVTMCVLYLRHNLGTRRRHFADSHIETGLPLGPRAGILAKQACHLVQCKLGRLCGINTCSRVVVDNVSRAVHWRFAFEGRGAPGVRDKSNTLSVDGTRPRSSGFDAYFCGVIMHQATNNTYKAAPKPK